MLSNGSKFTLTDFYIKNKLRVFHSFLQLHLKRPWTWQRTLLRWWWIKSTVHWNSRKEGQMLTVVWEYVTVLVTIRRKVGLLEASGITK
jgi:hypothetical protein